MSLVHLETLQDLKIGDTVAEGIMVTQILRVNGDILSYELRKIIISHERGHRYRSIGDLVDHTIIFPTKVLRAEEGVVNENIACASERPRSKV
jgi:hypothetical protein